MKTTKINFIFGRIQLMKNSKGKILLLPGDGIGPEVNKALKDVISSADSNTAINLWGIFVLSVL